MSQNYQLLHVYQQDQTLKIVIPTPRVMGDQMREILRGDFQQVAQLAPRFIQLDLRQVRLLDGALTSQLLLLWRQVQTDCQRFEVLLHPHLAEVFAVTRLDQLFSVTCETPAAGPATPLPASQP